MDWLAPVIAAILATVTGVTATVMRYRGSRADAREQKAPDVTDSWREADLARDRYWAVRELFYQVRSAFRSYVLRVQAGGSQELSVSERKAFEIEPPTNEFKE